MIEFPLECEAERNEAVAESCFHDLQDRADRLGEDHLPVGSSGCCAKRQEGGGGGGGMELPQRRSRNRKPWVFHQPVRAGSVLRAFACQARNPLRCCPYRCRSAGVRPTARRRSRRLLAYPRR